MTFRIDEAIRGVKKGQSIQISEWGGLWQAGERYQAGEHVLLLLYPQSKLGVDEPGGWQFGAMVHSERRQSRKSSQEINSKL